MAHLCVNPHYRDFLRSLGLHTAEDFLALPAVIVSGHPERHVGRVTLGSGPSAVVAFLKREHRVRRRDRLASALAGFGFASKSEREAKTLARIHDARIGCPEWMAYGKDGRGRAFLLARALEGAVELRRFLQDGSDATPSERRVFARKLGEALARMHEAGVAHGDLYAKHVFVDPCGQEVYYLDWQRSRLLRRVGRGRRFRDLAALDATLADGLASTLERAEFLRAYLAAAPGARSWRWTAVEIRERAESLLRRRHIRESREPPATGRPQELLWLDGEALCVTPEFWAELGGRVPEWLPLSAAQGERVARGFVPLPGGRRGELVRRCSGRPLSWLWAQFRRRPLISEDVRRAGQIFQLQRKGVEVPKLLAFGQRRSLPWRIESFLLTEAGPPAAGG